MGICTDAIDRLHSTANSHKRIMVIEIMGHRAGWLALYSGLAGGGDVILIPELNYSMKVVNNYLLKRARKKKPYSIVVVAEGIKKPSKDQSAASYIAERIEAGTGMETRKTILGYIQRGGSPSPMDRILATRFGAYTVDLIANENYGRMVIKKGEKIKDIKLSDVGSKLRLVPKNHKLIVKARGLDICFGG